jgi:hypothetical protein
MVRTIHQPPTQAWTSTPPCSPITHKCSTSSTCKVYSTEYRVHRVLIKSTFIVEFYIFKSYLLLVSSKLHTITHHYLSFTFYFYYLFEDRSLFLAGKGEELIMSQLWDFVLSSPPFYYRVRVHIVRTYIVHRVHRVHSTKYIEYKVYST